MKQTTLTLTLKYEQINNPCYRDISIDFTNLKLPEDGIPSELLIFEEPNINEDILSVPNFVIVFMHVSVFFFFWGLSYIYWQGEGK